ncbi:polyamine aminopropyltransferase [Gracilinema caldarium]|uniref:polyamine aminopropyltransferase n=1 Tax=Gracilinema caldarium TaxID=215591 RepID=UPI0026F1B595|nr:polyamine aminopropyltransferase [Gracilinema caldarium]
MRKFLDRILSSKSYEIRERVSRTSGWFYRAKKILYRGKTAYQSIELLETEEFGRTLLLDGATQVMEANEFQYHEPMAHIPLLAHPQPERVLIIGGGDGGVLREVLKHPTVRHVDLVELDDAVIEFSRTLLAFCSKGAFDDDRVSIHVQDGRTFVETANNQYDIVIMDMTDPAGPSLRLYSREFFLALSKLLKDERAYFIMHSESPDCRPEAFARIHRTLRSVFSRVELATTCIRMYGGLWSFAIASLARGSPSKGGAVTVAALDGSASKTASEPARGGTALREFSISEIRRRMDERGLSGLQVVAPETWQAFFAPYPYIQTLLAKEGDICTDENPEFPDSFDYRG